MITQHSIDYKVFTKARALVIAMVREFQVLRRRLSVNVETREAYGYVRAPSTAIALTKVSNSPRCPPAYLQNVENIILKIIYRLYISLITFYKFILYCILIICAVRTIGFFCVCLPK